MKNLLGLEDWNITDKIKSGNASISVRLSFHYPDVALFRHLSPEERKAFIAIDQKRKYSELINSGLIGKHKLVGTKLKPRGVEVSVNYKTLKKLARLSSVSHIFINAIDGAEKLKAKKEARFFCVKMTVAIEVEGQTSGLQTYEERYVLIRATSFENAYRKLEKHRDDYSQEYTNPYGHLVRWRIESMDDCYETYIVDFKDLENPEGAEVYSTLKKRRLTKERIWMGYLEK